MRGMFKIFYEEPFEDIANRRRDELRQQIRGENVNYLLNVNETEYLAHLVDKYELGPLELDFEGLFGDRKEVQVRAEDFPGRGFAFDVERGRSYTKPAIVYHLPYSGDEQLLRCRPNPYWSTVPVYLADGAVCFDVVDFYGRPEETDQPTEETLAPIKAAAEERLGLIRRQYAALMENLRRYNTALPEDARTAFVARRAELMRQNSLVKALGLPVRKASTIPQTFAIPAVRKKLFPKPSASTGPYHPDPTLDQSIYLEILRTIQDTGRVFERLPSTYAGKDEEALRDHLILQLEPRFEGSTTGETFNKAGKTDILIRHEGKNAFVGECKFWTGEKGYLETIDQILSYLTWRDSKAAIVCFVRNREFSRVLATIEAASAKHPCFIAFKGRSEETWFSYEFHLPGDPGRSVHLAVLCFHIPG
jgi:hypothetical protein